MFNWTEAEAESLLVAVRATHRIEPEYTAQARDNWCRNCGIDIYPVKGGWRHDMTVVRNLQALVTPGMPR